MTKNLSFIILIIHQLNDSRILFVHFMYAFSYFVFPENYIESEEKLADSLHQWEKWAKTTGCRDLKFLFRVLLH